jgi:hypothetical protein
MPSTYTLNNGIELIGTGEQSGTWGDTTNTNLGLLDAALDGQVTITLVAAGSSGSPNSLPITDGTASNGRNRMVVFSDSGDLGATAYVQLTPNDAEKIIYIRNSLSGSRSVILFQGTYNASNDYEVPAGTTAVVYFDGAGAGAVAANVFNNAYFDGLRLGSVSVTAILDEDNMASDSATALATQQSIKAYVDAQVDTVDTLAEILAIGNTTGATDIAVDSAQKVQFRDAAIYINSSVDGQLDIVADTEIQIAATTVDLNGNLDVSGTALVTGVLTTTATQVATGGITSGSNIVSDTDSTDDLGTTGVRWANLYVDGITATDQITATGFTGTLDGILGSGAAAAATVTTLDTSGAVNLNLVTDSTSSTSGALIVDGGVGIAKKLFVGTDLDVTGNAVIDGTALVTGVLTTTAATVHTGGITMPDNAKATFGDKAGGDLQIYHNANNSYIRDVGTGDLLITSDGTGVSIDKGTSEHMATFDIDGAVTLYHDALPKLATTATGIDVTGTVTATGTSVFASLDISGDIDVDGTTNLDVVDIDGATQIDATVTVGVDDTGYDVKFFGATAGAYMLWDESADDLILGGAAGLSVNSTALVTGVLTTTAATVFNGGFAAGGVGTFADGSNSAPSLTNTGDLNTGLYFPAADEVGLTVGGTQRLNVSATGIDVTGTATMDGLTVSGNVNIADAIPILRLDSPAVAWAGGEDLGGIDWYTEDASGDGPMVMARLVANSIGANTLPLPEFTFQTSLSSSALIDRLKIHNGGDISFYEDTGITPKLQWSASNERLFLTGSDYQFEIQQGANQPWYHRAISNGKYSLHLNGTGDIMTLDTSGNVTFGGDVIIPASSYLYFDGGGDTFMRETSPNIVQVNTAGAVAMTIDATQNVIIEGYVYPNSGIYLGGGVAANLLDDYEEGTFTPTVRGSTTAGSATYTIQQGGYTKIGNVVYWQVRLAYTGHTGTGNMQIPFPFTSANRYAAGNYSYRDALTVPASEDLKVYIPPSATYIGLYSVALGTDSVVALVLDTAVTDLSISGVCTVV